MKFKGISQDPEFNRITILNALKEAGSLFEREVLCSINGSIKIYFRWERRKCVSWNFLDYVILKKIKVKFSSKHEI